MIKFLSLFAPVALALPPAADVPVQPEAETESAPASATGRLTMTGEGADVPNRDVWLELLGLERTGRPIIYNQVRIDRRVVIRISPRSSRAPRTQLMADLPNGEIPATFKERKIGKCIPVRGIAGVQAGNGNRLIFYMRDQRIISANLEKACKASAYYSGFYVEPSKDGMLCVDRDVLQSRSGTNCELDRIRQLVRARS